MLRHSFRILPKLNSLTPPKRVKNLQIRTVTSQTDSSNTGDLEPSKSGFAKAFDKFEKGPSQPVQPAKSFATLLRQSKFIDLGDPLDKVVVGEIFNIVEDDLYIDFGWKFYCVCPRPQQNGESFIRGAKVKIQIKDLELSTRFLGSDRDLTILEADAVLIGLA